MMKANSKKILALSVLCLAVGFAPVFAVLAQNNNADVNKKNQLDDKRAEVRSEIQEKFCEKISELASKIGQRFSERRNRIEIRQKSRLKAWEDKKSERDAKLAEYRMRRDSNLEEHFAKLEERAQNQEQEMAALEFEKAMREAIETRRNAIDAAIEDFRAGVKNLHTARKTAVDGGVGAFSGIQEAALEKAQADCAAGKIPAQVRQSLRTALQNGQAKFSADKKNLEKTRTQMQSLIKIRKAAIEKAKVNFKAEIEKTRVELKKYFLDDDVSSDME